MTNSTCIIVDDEVDARYIIRKLLDQSFPSIKVLKEVGNLTDALKYINQLKPEIVFLDIQMKGDNSFDILESINYTPSIIFTTAYDKYAIQAVGTKAIDYLLKPINSKKFNFSVESALKHVALNQISQSDLKNTISIPTKTVIKIIEIQKIVKCEASSNYTELHLIDGSKHLVAKTLKEYELELMSHDFLRIHQSHLVNLNYIDSFNFKENLLILFDETSLPVARSKKTLTKEALLRLNNS